MLGSKVLLSLLPNEYLSILSEVKQLQQEELWLFICPQSNHWAIG